MMKKIITCIRTIPVLVILIAISLFSCRVTNRTVDTEKFNKLKTLVSEQRFSIENDWAYPTNGGNINLIGNPNYIRMDKDSVALYLPYFGVRHSGNTYGNDGGIEYLGAVNNLRIKENINKGTIELQFKANAKNENLEFTITLFPNKKARTYITSSQRSTISYEGELKPIEKL